MFLGIRQPVLAVLAAAVVTTALWLAPAQAQAPAQRSAAGYATQAFAATNDQRADHDLRKLRQRACLTRFAKRWAKKMARRGELVHQSLRPIMRRCDLRLAGENIAVGYRTGQAVVDEGWMESPGHRENILRPRFRLMGIGAHRDGSGSWWVSQVFGRS